MEISVLGPLDASRPASGSPRPRPNSGSCSPTSPHTDSRQS